MAEPNQLPQTRKTVATGYFLLAVSLPLGLTLEALHAMKVEVYLGSELRRDLWTLAHAHGAMLGLLCLLQGVVAERWISAAPSESSARLVRWGALAMPIGFFLGGVGNSEGDPSLAILLVPLGGVLLIAALVRCGLDCARLWGNTSVS